MKRGVKRTIIRMGMLSVILVLCVQFFPSGIFNSYLTGSDIIVAAHYAPWFKGVGTGNAWEFDVNGKPITTAYTPLLGRYRSTDQDVVAQHVRWARQYGISAFMMEWCGLASPPYTDSQEEPVRAIVDTPAFSRMKFFFVYSILSASKRDDIPPFHPVDFNDTMLVKKLQDDFRHAATEYFSRPNYLKIDGRPVVYLWATVRGTGPMTDFLTSLRQIMKDEFGYDLYLIGDSVGWGSTYNYRLTHFFDAVMPYAMVRMNGNPPESYDLTDSLEPIEEQYRMWRRSADDAGVDFIPGVLPGFDAQGAFWCYDNDGNITTPIVYRTPAGFGRYLEIALDNIDPDIRMVLITSWNEWNEGTNIEPSREFGYSYLATIPGLLRTHSTKKGPESVIRFRFPTTFDPPGDDDRQLSVAFDSVAFLDENNTVLARLDIGDESARPHLGLGWYGDEMSWGTVENYSWAGTNLNLAAIYVSIPPGTRAIAAHLLANDTEPISVELNGDIIGQIKPKKAREWEIYTIPVTGNR